MDEAALEVLATTPGRVYPSPSGQQLWQPPVPDRLPDTHLLRTLQACPSDPDAAALIEATAGGLDGEDAAAALASLDRAATTPGSPGRDPAGAAPAWRGR